MAQQSARRGWDNSRAFHSASSMLRVIWTRSANSPIRPQMESGPSPRNGPTSCS
jgi:hypothetical protein